MQPRQNTSIQSPEYPDLLIEQLVESPTKPRKRYQQSSLEEVAQSFRSRGVLEPLLVRPVEPERFEIVAGSRRYRAARIAELQTVPARVREMTDAEALEVQCIENIQREDIHPLEEAQGFRALLDLPDQQYTIARIGERAGKSAPYIAGRLKLTELIPDIANAFLADRVTLGHAADREVTYCSTAGTVQGRVQIHLDGQRPDGDPGACQRVNSLDRLEPAARSQNGSV